MDCLRRIAGRALGVAAIALVGASPASAGTLTFSHIFATGDVSMWGPGPGFTYSTGNTFDVAWNTSGSGGAIDCGPFGLICGGAELSASTSGQIGMDVGFGLTGGTMNAVVPVDLSLIYNDTVTGDQPIVIETGAAFTDMGLLTTQSPSMYAFVDLILELHASASATVCGSVGPIGDCASYTMPSVNFTRNPELLGLNVDNSGGLEVLGFPVPLTVSTAYVDVTASVPNIALSDTGTTVMNASGTASVLEFSSNLVNVAAALGGLPPLSGNLGPLTYDLLSASIGLDMGLFQSVKFEPFVQVRLDVTETGASYLVKAGEDATIDPGGFDTLNVTPTYFINGTFSNEMGIQLDPFVSASGGEFSVGSVGVGPLFSRRENLASFPVSVYDDAFFIGSLAAFRGQTFQITLAPADASVPEPASVWLLGTGVALLVWRARRRR